MLLLKRKPEWVLSIRYLVHVIIPTWRSLLNLLVVVAKNMTGAKMYELVITLSTP